MRMHLSALAVPASPVPAAPSPAHQGLEPRVRVGSVAALRGVLAVACGLAACASSSAFAGGSVKVSSDIVGMQIFIDGADTGLTTPATVGNLTAGRHEVRVRGDCRVGAKLVDVVDGRTSEVQLASAAGRGQLTVSVQPAGSTVRIDGDEVSGPHVVSCGEHTVIAAHPGYLQAVVKVDVDADERRSIDIELEELGTATLVMTVMPPTAEVILDGRRIGVGSITDDTVPAGPHIIEVRADGYQSTSQQLLIDAGETRAYTFDLKRAAGAAAPAVASGSAEGGTSDPPRGASFSPLKATGIGVATVGLGIGIYGLTRFGKAGSAYEEYVDRSANGPGPQSEIAAIRDDEIVPLRNLGLVTTGLGTALLAGGVTMVVAF